MAQNTGSLQNIAKRISWTNVVFFALTTLAALIFVPLHLATHGLSWGIVVLFALAFMISNMSITCGYHRYFSHRSYDVHPLIEFLYILIGAGAFQGSVLQWSTDHRRHHRKVDTDDDPYNINRGFWHAHIGWLLVKDGHPEASQYAKDLEKNRWIRLQHEYYGLFAAAVGFGLPALIGEAAGFGWWAGLLYGGIARVVVSQHSTFFINSLCHTLGRQPYTDRNSARDSFIMAVLTFGEGYHNYHHHFQADYRNGVRWYHFDPTKWWIQGLALMGLAKRLKRVSREEIMKARLAMEERMLLSKGACSDRVQQLKDRIIGAQKQMRELKEAYLRAKREARRAAKEPRWSQATSQAAQLTANARRRMRAEVKIAKLEFRTAYNQWRLLRAAIA